MFPSNAEDAKGMLKAACRLNDPVLFLEHKGLYRQGFASSKEPDSEYLTPIGKGVVCQTGEDITIIGWGAMIQKSIEAAKKVDFSIEVIDIRYIYPLDFEIIKNTIKKTNRVIIVHEDNITSGFGAEISARITEECFEYLDSPVKRVASKDFPVAYSQTLEDQILVQTDWIVEAINEIGAY